MDSGNLTNKDFSMILNYQEFKSVCYEVGVKNEWQIELHYRRHISFRMGFENEFQKSDKDFNYNMQFFNLGRLN